jgi:hypothetical protein
MSTWRSLTTFIERKAFVLIFKSTHNIAQHTKKATLWIFIFDFNPEWQTLWNKKKYINNTFITPHCHFPLPLPRRSFSILPFFFFPTFSTAIVVALCVNTSFLGLFSCYFTLFSFPLTFFCFFNVFLHHIAAIHRCCCWVASQRQ